MASENENLRNPPAPDLTDADEVPPPRPEAPESATEPGDEVEAKPGRLAQLVARLQKPPEPTRDAKAGERTRALVILAGTGIACLFLFFGLFTTDGGANRKERRNKPNLGRPEPTAAAQESANRSAVPQLSVTQQPNDDTGELSEKDLLATMRNRGTPVPTEPPPPPAPPKPAKPKPSLAGVNFEDPALMEAYRRQGLTPPPRKTEVVDWNAAVAEYQAKQKPPAPAQPPVNPNDALRKSSLVYVRSSAAAGSGPSMTIPAIERKASALLPQGTALVARLQHAVSSAAKVPVVAVIEYNYEQDGQLVVPAGSKAYGELSQVTPQGWVTLRFNLLELPGGQQEKIAASAVSMERTALRGEVNGKNSGKKFLTRALTGVGTIAAYAVGGRGLGSNALDNSILLRERLASNVALAGEQEMAQLAYQQNIVVTVPANTRFYLVLHEAGVTRFSDSVGPASASPATAGPPALQTVSAPGLTPQEMRDMIQLRNEMREMNRLMTQSLQGLPPLSTPPQEDR